MLYIVIVSIMYNVLCVIQYVLCVLFYKKMTLFVVNKEGGGYSSYSMCLTCRARAPPSQFNGYEGLGLINCLGLL